MSFDGANTRGRPKGALAYRSYEFLRALHDNDFDAASELITIYREAKKTYDNYAVIYEALEDARTEQGQNPIPTEDKADKYLKIALDAVKEIASYTYPKLKSIEHQAPSPLDGMTNQQKLDAMREAMKVLEKNIELQPGRNDTGSDQVK